MDKATCPRSVHAVHEQKTCPRCPLVHESTIKLLKVNVKNLYIYIYIYINFPLCPAVHPKKARGQIVDSGHSVDNPVLSTIFTLKPLVLKSLRLKKASVDSVDNFFHGNCNLRFHPPTHYTLQILLHSYPPCQLHSDF